MTDEVPPIAGEDDHARTLRRAAEALLLVTEEPLAAELMAQLLEVPVARIEGLCQELAAEYDATDRGFQLVRVAGGWRYQTHPDTAPYIERFVLEGQSGRLSNAALETLAIVAYKQPISRAQIAAIRGVNVDGVMRTLTHRGYVDEVGRDHGPGQAVLYGTTPMFLEKLGLDRIDELPPLGEFVPGADVFEALERGLRPDAGDEETVDVVDAGDEDVSEDGEAEPGSDG
jgi:segregation and condensation protein B